MQLTIAVENSDLRTFLFPVSGFCYFQDICITKKQKNWVDKSAKISYHDNTALNNKILPKMLFIWKEVIFATKKCSLSLAPLFLPFKKGL